MRYDATGKQPDEIEEDLKLMGLSDKDRKFIQEQIIELNSLNSDKDGRNE